MLSRKDLGKKALLPRNVICTVDGSTCKKLPEQGPFVIGHPVFTSGIDYVNFQFDFTKIPARLFPYIPILRTVLGALDTEHYSYAALDQEVTIRTGGIYPNTTLVANAHRDDTYKLLFEVTMKVLDRHLPEGTDLVLEILQHTKYDDLSRIIEVLEEEVSEMKASLADSGHVTAACRARSQCDVTAKVQDALSGIDAYRGMSKILQDLKDGLFRRENLSIDVTADAETIGKSLHLFHLFTEKIPSRGDTWRREQEEAPYRPALTAGAEGFVTAGQVQYVALAGNFKKQGYAYTGAMDVLRVIMGYD